jgi:hypothetical protein
MNTPTTKKFSDFGIVAEYTGFTGTKMKVNEILNLEIKIYDFKIEPSTSKPGTMRLVLDFELHGKRKIVFTSAKILQQTIQKVPKTDFPFDATIVLKEQHLEFV